MNIQNKKQWDDAFIEACERGEIDDVRHLCQKQYLDRGWADIHDRDEYGFRWACYKGHLEVVKYLLTSPELKEAGHTFAKLHANQEEGFYMACGRGHWEVVRWLVMDHGIEKTPAIEEIINGYPQAKEYFRVLEELQEIQKALDITPQDSFTLNDSHKKDERAAKKAKKL